MRTLTSAALTEIAKQFGTEPVTIVEIEWSPGSVSTYADKNINSQISGKILSLSNIELAVRGDNAQTSNLSLSLDDTDGAIKTILDVTNIHKRKCTVYQWFGDLSLTDKFHVSNGQISTPFSWGEGDRQLDFDIVNEIENFEVGFTPEEGQLDFVSEELEGKSWPLCFGHVIHVPAQKVHQNESAVLLERFCVPDPLLQRKLRRVEEAYQVEAFMFAFWDMVRNGIAAIAPSASWLLSEYISIIKQEDAIIIQILNAQFQLDQTRNFGQKFPKNIFFRLQITFFTNLLNQLGIASQVIALRKEYLENLIDVLCFYYEQDKKAVNQQIQAYNNMRRLFGTYLDIQQEICDQNECFKTTVAVRNEDIYPNNTPIDVAMNGIRFRVKFDHSQHKMTFLAGPLNRYSSVPVGTWQLDDEPCTEITELNSLSLFWLQDDPPCNLEGMYLLVTKRQEPDTIIAQLPEGVALKHIIKVRRQVGRKVYFELVKWNPSGGKGQPKGLSVNAVINEIVEPEGGWVLGPFGAAIPAGLFTGQLNPDIWNRPETAFLLAILVGIPGGVTKEELRNLATLVYRLEFDTLKGLIIIPPTARDIYTIIGEDVATIDAVSSVVLDSWVTPTQYLTPAVEWPDDMFINLQPNTDIRGTDTTCELYIANLLPSVIKAVHAYRTNEDGDRYLAPIPQSYYIKNEAAPLGTYTVTALTFIRPLTDIAGEKWEDNVYVTLESSVGRNVVDVMEWLIDTYTDSSANVANFAATKTLMAAYPVDFCIFDRPNVLDELYRIAWESRLAIYHRNGEFFLKYLAAEPIKDATLTEVDIERESLRIQYTATEQLMTRIIATYDKDYLPLETGERKPRVVLRHNVNRYGLHSQAEHFHIFSNRESVEKSATFWLIRYSNTWKRITCRVFQPHFRLEPLDTIEFNLSQPFVANVAIKTVLERVSIDTESNLISFDVLTPVKAGEMLPYPFFWPANLPANTEWPTAAEIAQGFAGGYGPGSGVVGTIDDCPPTTCGS